MRRTLPLLLLIALIVLAAVLLWPSSQPQLLTLYPATVSQPGAYHLDPYRYVEIKKADGRIEYWECKIAVPEDASSGQKPVVVSYGGIHLLDLHPGWAIGLAPPDTIVIEDGAGSTIRRTFGEEPNLESQIEDLERSITRRPSEPSSSMTKIIAGEGTLVPIDEVNPVEPGGEAEEAR